jgi:hypothetical protein
VSKAIVDPLLLSVRWAHPPSKKCAKCPEISLLSEVIGKGRMAKSMTSEK